MIVLFWSRAARDLLKSFGWGIAALHRLHAATKLPSPRRPPHRISRSRCLKRRLLHHGVELYIRHRRSLRLSAAPLALAAAMGASDGSERWERGPAVGGAPGERADHAILFPSPNETY